MQNHAQMLHHVELNEKLFSQGYVTLPLLNTEEVALLKAIFYKFHSDDEVEGLYVSSSQKDQRTIQEISDSIQVVFERAMLEHVKDGQTLGGTFISKPANQTEALEPHQDWSIVDESRFRSFTIWVPLMDVDENSGCMYVLPGSHNLMRGYRHITIPSVFGTIYQHIWKRMKPIHLKAGEAIIFDHALGHASKPNGSDK
ncbi:MAG: ectoine hydroxylase-related dioxygenase (phytanoyl-CoA dioxygenase family), partial [Bacteroidia bacterium]